MDLTLFAETETNWVVVLIGATTGILGAVAGVLGAWGIMRSKLIAARNETTEVTGENDRKNKREAAAEERRTSKSALDEAFRLLEVRREEHEEDRTLIHDLRGDLGTAQTRLAVCEFERGQMRGEIDAMREALEKNGIVVHYRRLPVPPETFDARPSKGTQLTGDTETGHD